MPNSKLYAWLGWLPLLLCLSCLLFFPLNWNFYYNFLTNEDGVIEWLTVILTITACVFTLKLTWNKYKTEGISLDSLFLLLFAAGCVFFAGEEISWGQRIIGLETAEISPWLADVNRQHELNLHNIRAFSKIRLIADVFCLIWGIIIPLVYLKRSFPIKVIQPYMSPCWLIPGFATCLLITLPLKICESIFGEIQWFEELRLGELKETALGLVILLYSLHLLKFYQNRSINSPSPQIDNKT